MEKETIFVVVTSKEERFWHREGEIHEVINKISFDYGDGSAHFEKPNGYCGISLDDCRVLKERPIKEYTIEQLQEKLGEEFKIIK